jgi:hypothetical protein
MGYAKIKGELTSRIGRKVTFNAPHDIFRSRHRTRYGTIIDEVWAKPKLNKSKPRSGRNKSRWRWGDYSSCAQLIKWDDGRHSIRLAYYRRPFGKNWWEYASQTTITASCKTIKTLLKRTLAQKTWFQRIPKPTPMSKARPQ